MQVVLFADPVTRRRLRSMVEGWGEAVIAEASIGSAILDVLPNASPDLLVLDPDLDFHAAARIARAARGQSALVAFVAPIDPIVAEVLQGLDPIGFLPRAFDRGDVGSLLAGARSEIDAAPPRIEPSMDRSGPAPGDRRLVLISLASMLIAVAIGYFLPDGLAMFERAGHKPYYIVVGLALISISSLLAARRPITAGVQVGLIALVTILPTQQ